MLEGTSQMGVGIEKRRRAIRVCVGKVVVMMTIETVALGGTAGMTAIEGTIGLGVEVEREEGAIRDIGDR